MNSLTTDDETLLGSVPDTAAAPAEMRPINYPTDPGDIDDMIGDTYKNGAGRCPPAVDGDGGFHDKCVAAASSPNFEQQMDAEVGLMALEWFGGLGKALSPLVGFLDPTADARDCLAGDQGACWWAAASVFPFGRFGRLLRNIDEVGRGGGGGLRYFPAPKSPPGIPGLKNAKPKTPVQGGGGMRKRWTDQEREHLRVGFSTWRG